MAAMVRRRRGASPGGVADGKEIETYDAVFHPKTVQLANDSQKFMCFLVEISVEHINEGYQKTLLPGVPLCRPTLRVTRYRAAESSIKTDTVPTRPNPSKQNDAEEG